jgi:hypothetical protein
MSPAGRLKVARQRDELFVRRGSGNVLAESLRKGREIAGRKQRPLFAGWKASRTAAI